MSNHEPDPANSDPTSDLPQNDAPVPANSPLQGGQPPSDPIPSDRTPDDQTPDDQDPSDRTSSDRTSSDQISSDQDPSDQTSSDQDPNNQDPSDQTSINQPPGGQNPGNRPPDDIPRDPQGELENDGTAQVRGRRSRQASPQVLASLKTWANLAQQTPQHDPRRSWALGHLITLAQPWLTRATTQNVGHHHPLYDEIYLEAIQDLWIWVCDHIENYDPERATVLGWLNFYLSRRFFPNAAARVLDFQHRRSWPAGDEPANQRFWETLPNKPTPMDDYLEGLQSYIRTSADPILNESIRDRPQATLRRILIYKMAGKSLQEIADIFDSKPSTVHSFYRRRKRLLYESIKKHCEDEKG